MGKLKSLFKTYADLPREIYILFVARVINRFGGFVHAFITMFLTIKMGMTPLEVGTVAMFLGFASMAGSMLGGSFGDILGRKRTYVVAQGLAAIFLIPCGFLGNDMRIPVLIIISTFFNNMVGPISSAMVQDIVTKEDRKRAFSLLYYGINVGVAIGPLVAGLLFTNHIQWIFWGDAITTFFALAMIILFINETKLTKEEMIEESKYIDNKEKAITGWRGLAIIAFLQRPILVFYTLFSILTSFVYAQVNFALPLSMKALFGEELGVSNFSIMMSFNAVVVLVFTILVTKLTDKFKPIYNIAFANVLYAVGFAMMIFVGNMPMLLISVFVWTIGEIQGVTNSGVFVANHTPITHRSRFNAVIKIIRSIGYMTAPIISGWLLEYISLSQLWIIVALVALLAFAGLHRLGVVDTKREKKAKSLASVH